MSEMTDRELLELAARAAGMYVLPEPWPDSDGWFFCLQHGEPAMHFRKYGDICYNAPSWSPRTDDGDALRLAVKLALFFDDDFQVELGAIFRYPGDLCAATRRAIVRAAAAIGAKS